MVAKKVECSSTTIPFFRKKPFGGSFSFSYCHGLLLVFFSYFLSPSYLDIYLILMVAKHRDCYRT
jgi:hypothetical protein